MSCSLLWNPKHVLFFEVLVLGFYKIKQNTHILSMKFEAKLFTLQEDPKSYSSQINTFTWIWHETCNSFHSASIIYRRASLFFCFVLLRRQQQS